MEVTCKRRSLYEKNMALYFTFVASFRTCVYDGLGNGGEGYEDSVYRQQCYLYFATMFGEDLTEVDFDGYTNHETAQFLKAATSGAIFSMNNATGQYIRIGIIRGTFEIRNIYSDDQMINPRELVVYGQRLPIGDVDLDGEATVEDVLLALHGILNEKENIRADVNCDGKNDLKDVLCILRHVVEKGE